MPGHPLIESDIRVCGGRPVIRGTRIRVLDILEMMAGGMSVEEILADYEQLSEADVRAALAYSAEAHRHPVILAAE